MDRLRSVSALNSLSGLRLASVDLCNSRCTPRTPSTGAAVLASAHDTKRMTALFLSLFLLSSIVVVHSNRVASASQVIVFRSASSAANGDGPTLTLSTPAGVQPGDLMLAGLFDRGSPAVTPPAGWTFIRHDSHGNVYYRFATDSEPASYTWSFSPPKPVVGAIVVYTGVGSDPVSSSSGRRNRASHRISAPSAEVNSPGSMAVGFFGMARFTKIYRPAGMTRRALVRSGSGPAVAIQVADVVRNVGPTGRRVAWAGRRAPNVGELVVLSPSTKPPPPPPPGGPYRAFSDDSYWNTPVPSNAPIDPRSGNYVGYLKRNNVGNFVMLSGADRDGFWGTPIYWADTSDPTYQVKSTRYYVPPEFTALRIPRGAKPDPSSDAEMMIYDLAKGYVAALWLAKYDPYSDTWTAGGGDVFYVGSNGLDGRLPESDEHRNTGAHRGAAPPIFAIRLDEVQAGSINHVLKVAIPNPNRSFVFPMTGSDGHSTDPNAPPEGARFRLKRSIDLDRMNLTPAQYAVAKAAQDYGFVVTDVSGAPVAAGLENVVAEGRGWRWNGVLAWDSLRVFPLDAYEFIQNGNGR
jgi:hypothetical protein